MNGATYLFLILIGVTVILMMFNLIMGKYVLIKYLAVNVITACSVVVVSLLAVTEPSRACYLDVAVIYVLISFIFNIAVMKYLKELR